MNKINVDTKLSFYASEEIFINHALDKRSYITTQEGEILLGGKTTVSRVG